MHYKCAACGREIEVSLPYSGQYIYYNPKKKWFHLNCFKQLSQGKRISVESWEDKTKDYVLCQVSKDRIDALIKKHYNTSVPQYIYVRLDQIYKGTRKGLAQPIPPHELLDILLRKMHKLDMVAIKKQETDPYFKGIKRFNYDLAVAVNSYQSYKEWLCKQQLEDETTAASVKEIQTYTAEYIPPAQTTEENISDIIDSAWEDDE